MPANGRWDLIRRLKVKIVLGDTPIVVSVVSDLIPSKYCTATAEVESVYLFSWAQ